MALLRIADIWKALFSEDYGQDPDELIWEIIDQINEEDA